MSYASRHEVVASQSLGATVVLNSAPVPCQGANEVYFIAKATNTVQLAAAVYEYSIDDGATWSAASAVFLDATNVSMAAADLSVAGGGVICVTPRTGAPALRRMMATHVRCKVTGHATLTITGFRMEAVVMH